MPPKRRGGGSPTAMAPSSEAKKAHAAHGSFETAKRMGNAARLVNMVGILMAMTTVSQSLHSAERQRRAPAQSLHSSTEAAEGASHKAIHCTAQRQQREHGTEPFTA